MPSQEVVLVPYPDGPYLVRGPLIVRDQEGNEIELSRRTVALCRCGKSRVRPFCDGTHHLVRFRSASRPAESPAPAAPEAASSAPPEPRMFSLPPARGPWTEALYELLTGAASDVDEPLPVGPDPLADDDFQMALYLCYELHYAGIEGVDERAEWDPAVIAFRGALEVIFESALHDLARPPVPVADSVGAELGRLVEEDDGPPLSRYVEQQATADEVLEHVIHRSAYQLKEADPHSFAIARLAGPAKVALVEIQADEYGDGRPERMHAALFAKAMRGLGLDDRYGAHLHRLPGITLATVNLMSLFGLHRRLRGALAGHLAVFEMTSSVPNRRYGNGLRRLGFDAEVTDFYDEHVTADAVHESIAAWDLADGLARSEPRLAGDIVFGARALLALEASWAAHLLGAWAEGRSSLLAPRELSAVG